MPNVYYPVTLEPEEIKEICDEHDALRGRLARANIKLTNPDIKYRDQILLEKEREDIVREKICLWKTLHESVRQRGRIWENETGES